MLKVGVIGYGGRARGLCELMGRMTDDAKVVAVADVRAADIKQEIMEAGQNAEAIRFYADADEMLDNESLDGVMIGTRCSKHAYYAIKVLNRNLPLFLEKPVATNMADLVELRDAAEVSASQVVVSFPLRVTPIVLAAKEIIEAGTIGTVEHVQAYNNVPYGWCYFQSWYRDENETQGLWLQKATHDFDYINFLLGIKPVTICAMTSKQIMKGTHPAGLKCDECPEWETCLESPYHYFASKAEHDRVKPTGLLCAFAEDTGNEDSGSAIIRYETGMHVNYTQNFFARKAAGKRGARLLGYKGTLEFDWFTEEIRVMMHHKPRVDTIKIGATPATHGGGDLVLIESFLRLMKVGGESVSPLCAGLLSVLMCLKAKESDATNTFQNIDWPSSAGN